MSTTLPHLVLSPGDIEELNQLLMEFRHSEAMRIIGFMKAKINAQAEEAQRLQLRAVAERAAEEAKIPMPPKANGATNGADHDGAGLN